jgi:hypothetical protein
MTQMLCHQSRAFNLKSMKRKEVQLMLRLASLWKKKRRNQKRKNLLPKYRNNLLLHHFPKIKRLKSQRNQQRRCLRHISPHLNTYFNNKNSLKSSKTWGKCKNFFSKDKCFNFNSSETAKLWQWISQCKCKLDIPNKWFLLSRSLLTWCTHRLWCNLTRFLSQFFQIKARWMWKSLRLQLKRPKAP